MTLPRLIGLMTACCLLGGAGVLVGTRGALPWAVAAICMACVGGGLWTLVLSRSGRRTR